MCMCDSCNFAAIMLDTHGLMKRMCTHCPSQHGHCWCWGNPVSTDKHNTSAQIWISVHSDISCYQGSSHRRWHISLPEDGSNDRYARLKSTQRGSSNGMKHVLFSQASSNYKQMACVQIGSENQFSEMNIRIHFLPSCNDICFGYWFLMTKNKV